MWLNHEYLSILKTDKKRVVRQTLPTILEESIFDLPMPYHTLSYSLYFEDISSDELDELYYRDHGD